MLENLIIHIISLHPFAPLVIPNVNICRCPWGQQTISNNVAQAVNGNLNFVYAPGVFRIKQEITKNTSHFSGVPNKAAPNHNSKPPSWVTYMPLGAPSISTYGSLVRLDAEIVALRGRCA